MKKLLILGLLLVSTSSFADYYFVTASEGYGAALSWTSTRTGVDEKSCTDTKKAILEAAKSYDAENDNWIKTTQLLPKIARCVEIK